MYQPVRQDDLLGARNLNIFKRNGKPRTGKFKNESSPDLQSYAA